MRIHPDFTGIPHIPESGNPQDYRHKQEINGFFGHDAPPLHCRTKVGDTGERKKLCEAIPDMV
jgi:hypothetical protein